MPGTPASPHPGRRDSYRAHVADEQPAKAAGAKSCDPAAAEKSMARKAAAEDTQGTATGGGHDRDGADGSGELACYRDPGLRHRRSAGGDRPRPGTR